MLPTVSPSSNYLISFFYVWSPRLLIRSSSDKLRTILADGLLIEKSISLGASGISGSTSSISFSYSCLVLSYCFRSIYSSHSTRSSSKSFAAIGLMIVAFGTYEDFGDSKAAGSS